MRFVALALLAATALGQTSAPSISLDPSRPYIDIVFDRLGKRAPVFDGEPDEGVWLRLRNNCVLPVHVQVLGRPHQNPGYIIPHEVVSEARTRLWDPKAPKPKVSKPEGYGSPDVVNSREIPPGGDLVFSVPLRQVTRNWSIRVEVSLVHQTIPKGNEPRTFVDFDWWGLSPEARKMSDADLFGTPASNR
jgi:hypothetical protein